MLKYLDYVRTKVLSSNERIEKDKVFLVDKVNLLVKYWNCYQNNYDNNPFHPEEVSLYDIHNFNLPTGEIVQISWDIEKLYKKTILVQPKEIPLDDFEQLIMSDIKKSIVEFTRVEKEVISIQKHKYEPILVLNFSPQHAYIILDGRHRYIEKRKFSPETNIKTYILNSNDHIDCLCTKKDYVTYIILHNIEVISNYLGGNGKLQSFIDF